MEIFTVKDLSFSYPNSDKVAISNLNFNVHQGELLALIGKSGCGKSTLLRNLKPALAPHGKREGEILFMGEDLYSIDKESQATKIGYVLQNPDNQIVTDKVWHELAFGLENLGVDSREIRVKVAEMASFFGIQTWFNKNVKQLSGGQKQLLNLAAVMIMQPEILILDEPTSQLDPITAGEFIRTVKKINRELGTTIIITEHRLEEVLPLSDRVIVMENGKIIVNDTPSNTGGKLAKDGNPMFLAMPTPLQAYAMLYEDGFGRELECPVDVKQGREWLREILSGREINHTEIEQVKEVSEEIVIDIKDTWFRYEKHGNDVIQDLNLQIKKGEFLAIVGGNGTGKTTTLTLISGIHKAYRGKIKLKGKEIGKYKNEELFSNLLGVLPQNPQTIFVEDQVKKDLLEIFQRKKIPKEEQQKRLMEVCKLTEIEGLLNSHPYDISGGEQQRVALAKILLLDPEIILLDEPTKGIDNHFKEKFAVILDKLKDKGKTIVMVSHDVEFCALHTDRCAMFFGGSITTINTPRKFFSGNSFYTTAANKMSRKIYVNAISARDIYKLTKANLEDTSIPPKPKKPNKPVKNTKNSQGTSLSTKGKNSMLGFASFALLVGALFLTIRFHDQKGYLIGSVLVALAVLIPFFGYFENRRPKAREIVIIAVLVAIAVAGRAAFALIPSFKPIFAIIIISGCSLGASSGFIVGAMTAFVSNFIFGQGPWTPFQMVAWGLIGFFAGVLANNLLKSRKNWVVGIYGVLATYLLHGGITGIWSVLSLGDSITWATIISIYGGAFTLDTILAISTVLFLILLNKPMSNKIDRIRIKYGLLE
ncbi:MAG: energy-coupling factor transporter ATPase [Anaerovoracaceae bacterium]